MAILPNHLTDIEEIHQLKARYFRFLDTKQWDALRTVFSDDATFEGTSRTFDGPDDFIDKMRARLGPATTVHQGHMPEIQLLGPDRARGIWAMHDVVEYRETQTEGPFAGVRGFIGFGHYQEEYSKKDSVWRISLLRLTRLRLDPILGDGPSFEPTWHWLASKTDNWLSGE